MQTGWNVYFQNKNNNPDWLAHKPVGIALCEKRTVDKATVLRSVMCQKNFLMPSVAVVSSAEMVMVKSI